MFSKLLKHEFKAQGGLFGILSIAALAAGILGSLMLSLILRLAENGSENEAAIGIIIAAMALMGTMFAIVAYIIAVEFLLYFRFYKHFFSDEGYLTFTLPASTHQHLLSSILNITIWSVIATCVTLLSITIIMTPLFVFLLSQGTDFSEITLVFDVFAEEFGSGLIALQILAMVASFVYSLILPLASITIGSLVAKKHKILAAFGIGYGISMAVSFISGILSTVSMLGEFAMSDTSGNLTMTFTLLIPSLLYLGLGIGGYFIMHHLVDKKLNLP